MAYKIPLECYDQHYPSPPESAYMLYYYPSINRFVDDEDNILHDLTDLFDVWELDEWKRTQDYGILLDRKGDWCELYYADSFEEREFLERLRINREIGCMNKLYHQKAFC